MLKNTQRNLAICTKDEREDCVLDGPLLRMKRRGRSAYSGGVGEHGELGLGLLDALGGESLEISLGLGERGAS